MDKFTKILIIFLSLLLFRCSGSQSASASNLMRAFIFSTNSSSENLALSISGNLSQNGTSISNTLVTTNATSITTSTAIQQRDTSSEIIRCIDYNLNSGKLTCYLIINTANINGANDGCYHLYYSSSDKEKLQSIASFKSVTFGSEIKFLHQETIPTGAIGFSLFSCNSTEKLLVSSSFTDYTASDGILTDENGNYTINVEAGKKSTLTFRRATKDLGNLIIDLSSITTEEGLNEIKDTPSRLNISVPSGFEHSISIQGPVRLGTESIGVTTAATSSSDLSSTNVPDIDITTFATEVGKDSNLTSAIPAAFSFRTSAFTFTKEIAISTQNPITSGTILSCSSTPALPAGLSINASTCAISGTPTTEQKATTYVIIATGSLGVTSASLSIAVADTIDTASWSAVQSTLNTQAALGLSGSETADTSTLTGLSGTQNWFGGILANNGKIYGIPGDSTSVLIVDPNANTIDTTTISGLSGSLKWGGGVLAPNGKIYGIPKDSTSVLIIDPTTDTADTTTISGLSSDTGKWADCVLAPNGKIYGIPNNATEVLIIDPTTDTADTTTITGLSSDTGKWFSGVLANNGKIYGIPFNATSVLIIDPTTNTVDTTTMSGLSSNQYKWIGGTIAANGKIYAMPFSDSSVLIIDPSTNTADTTTITGLGTTNFKWSSGVLAANGKIYAAPHKASTVLIIDPTSNTTDITTITGLSTSDNKWTSSTFHPNGKIYMIPKNASEVLILDTKSNGVWPNDFYLSGYFNNN